MKVTGIDAGRATGAPVASEGEGEGEGGGDGEAAGGGGEISARGGCEAEAGCAPHATRQIDKTQASRHHLMSHAANAPGYISAAPALALTHRLVDDVAVVPLRLRLQVLEHRPIRVIHLRAVGVLLV